MIRSTRKLSNIIVGLSGGVDSSVSAYLLKKAGHQVQAVFMKNWEGDDEHCPQAKDFADAQKVCEQIGMPLQLVNFADEYWQRVFSIFLHEYRAGRTPNPDVLCNREIKFRAFLDYAIKQGADAIAMGHYARISSTGALLKGCDDNKDQSYFLYLLTQAQLAQSLFPVGELSKPQVREIAREAKLVTHAKKDSTGICFIGERKFAAFLKEFLPAQPGNIETIEGEILGQHDGLMFYTLGQRQGLKIGGKASKEALPWYVVKKDLQRNVLHVVQGDHPALYTQSFLVRSMHWIQHQPTLANPLQAKIRYRQEDQSCALKKIDADTYQVTFATPQRAVTPGQSIVFYEHDICLGGGIIETLC